MAAPFHVLGFSTEYVRQQGKKDLQAVDKVRYCAIGGANRSETVKFIRDISRVPEHVDPDDIAGVMAKERWNYIKPLYEAWKQNHDLPVNGTPLSAWPGVTPAQAEIIRMGGLVTVEDVAQANDAALRSISLPGMVELQRQARAFVENADKTVIAEKLAQRDAEMEDLKAQIAELKALSGADGKPKRGRTKKVEQPEEAAA